MRHIVLALISVQTVLAKDVVDIIAYKKSKSPAVHIDEHSPNKISFNKEYIQSKPAVQNAFALVETAGAEYQRNLQDSGGHTGVSVNQLPFYYTGTFVDGIYVPESSLDVSQFFGTHAVDKMEVMRGAATTGVRPSSLSGAVEITTQDAMQDKTEMNALYGGYGLYNLGGLKSRKIGKNNGVLFAITTNGQGAIDENSDKIAESPRIRNTFATFAHNFKNDDITAKTRFDFSKNNRVGGSMINNMASNSGNPFDFSKIGGTSSDSWLLPDGTTEKWDKGAVGFLEIIDTTRASVLSSIDSKNYVGGGSISILKRDNFYSGNKYKADEMNIFGTLARKISAGDLKIKLGGDFSNQVLNSTITNDSGRINNPDGYSYTMLSGFGQMNYQKNNWDFDLSSRFGVHNKFGFIGTAKAKAVYHHTENMLSVFAIGNGYYVAGSSFEQNHELVEGAIKQFTREINTPTQSLNATYNFILTYDKFQSSFGYNYNRLDNISYFDLYHQNQELYVTFRPLQGFYQNHGLTLDGTYFINDIFTFNFGGERFWHDFSNLEQGFVMLSRPDYKIFGKIITKIEKHQFVFGATLFGRQNLQQFYGTTYNLQGQENKKYAPEFMLFDFDASYKITGKYKLLYGINNIGHYVQIRNMPQIAVVKHDNEYELHNRNSWGPVVGRRFYIGIKGEF